MNQKPPPGQTTITITTTDGYPPQQQPYVPAQPYVPPTQPAYPPIYAPPPQDGWFERNQRNKPQSNSVGSASLVFITGGMSIAWSVGFTVFMPGFNNNDMKTAWFVGGIIGVLLAAILVYKVAKKIIYLCACVLVIVGGILFTAAAANYTAIMLARYMNGIANGLIIVPCLVLTGEEAVKESRGMIAATVESMSFGLGIYLQILFSVLWTDIVEDAISINQIHGILAIIYGGIGLLTAAFLVIESPVHYLVQNKEQAAIDSLCRLQRPRIVNYETYILLEEHKRYIAVNRAHSFSEALQAAVPAICKLCFYRGMLAMTYSAVANVAFAQATVLAYRTYIQWPFIIFATLRWLTTLIVAIMIDSAGRKKPMINSMLGCSVLSLAVAAIYTDHSNIYERSYMEAVMWLLIVFQLCAGAYGCSSSAYLTEAFPLAIKSIGIASAFIVEMLVSIIILLCDVGSGEFAAYFYTFACLGVAFCIVGHYAYPETMGMTLREAQAQFSSWRALSSL